MSPRPAPLPRWIRILVPVTILAILLLAVGTVGFVQSSSQPGFCKSCHIMQPYYASWATSSHRNVSCIECHIAPGIKAEAMSKFQAANMVVKYFTGAYGTRPWAEIDDATCLRSGCHSERLIEGVVEYRGVRFDHTDHLGEQRRGMQLRCTSCHSQIVQGTHIAVTETTCFLCHFKDRPPGAPLAGCTGCHPSPPRVVSPAGYTGDHAQYVTDRIACLSCHTSVTTGAGTVDQARCFSCHNEPARIKEFNNPPLLHRVHVADHDIACIQCHGPIEHRVGALTATVELDCRSCHSNVHDAERRLFAGFGGHGTKEAPSSMFLARVSCLGCHGEATTFKGHERVQLAGEPSCLSCHGIRYANILPAWQRDMAAKVARVGPVVSGARAAVRVVPLRQRAVADSLVRLAEDNVELVRVGKGAHNIVYADRLLRASLALVREAVQHGALPYSVPAVNLGPPVSENACLQCHLGVEQRRGKFQGQEFSHTPHVVRAGLECSACHTALDKHGGTTLSSPASCDACHHPVIQPENCARCHAGPGGAPQPTTSLPAGEFSHRTHAAANLAGAARHTPPLMSARDLQ
ncbi:MAG TPA: NapC/NirT family cytochrome c, partial [Candidatus Dormibacteraeota bacterium]|nr:NapC/NirT family cytochrome c [Candidatus Dormibacteraeota bacterium]